MKTAIALAALAVFGQGDGAPMSKAPGIQTAMVCFKTGERQSGLNKICYYDCLGSAAAITISAVELCPLSINQ